MPLPPPPNSNELFQRSPAEDKKWKANFLWTGFITQLRDLLVNSPFELATFTVAGLPTSPRSGSIAFASNGRKGGEGVGAGTGVTAVYSNGAWRRLSDETAVAA